jgi:translation initiation factor 2 beta subunit (eIF-2beta)/eIF-5
MICSVCEGHDVTWRGRFACLTHTECAYCGAINSQVIEEYYLADRGSESSLSEFSAGEVPLG